MSVMRSTKKAKLRAGGEGSGISKLGDDYVTMLDSIRHASTTERIRADREQHQATRPCPVCDIPMTAGECADHGTPAEDRGDWLWAK